MGHCCCLQLFVAVAVAVVAVAVVAVAVVAVAVVAVAFVAVFMVTTVTSQASGGHWFFRLVFTVSTDVSAVASVVTDMHVVDHVLSSSLLMILSSTLRRCSC